MADVQPLYRAWSGHTYLRLWGQYWRIHGEDTLNAVFRSPEIEDVGFPITAGGPDIAQGSFLFRAPGAAALYFMCGGNMTAYHIWDMNAVQYFQFNGTPLPTGDSIGEKVVSNWLLSSMRKGSDIRAP
jgi:hypothetical protein